MSTPEITLRDLHKYTPKEVVRNIMLRLKEQGSYGWDPKTEFCSYRTPVGACCAIGMLVPEPEYHPDLECVSVYSFPKLFDLDPLPEGMIDVLIASQGIHDSAAESGHAEVSFDHLLRAAKTPLKEDYVAPYARSYERGLPVVIEVLETLAAEHHSE